MRKAVCIHTYGPWQPIKGGILADRFVERQCKKCPHTQRSRKEHAL